MTDDVDPAPPAREDRDSVFLQARITARNGSIAETLRIRNISASGLMAEGTTAFDAGEPVEIELRNVGTVAGNIVWARDNRIGVAFARRIDPKLPRTQIGSAKPAAPPPKPLGRLF